MAHQAEYLVDNSALNRVGQGPVRERLQPLIDARIIGTSSKTSRSLSTQRMLDPRSDYLRGGDQRNGLKVLHYDSDFDRIA